MSGLNFWPFERKQAPTAATIPQHSPSLVPTGVVFIAPPSDPITRFVVIPPPPPSLAPVATPSEAKEPSPMSNQAIALFDEAISFIDKAAPGIEASIVADAKDAFAKAETAFAPVAEAAAADAVNLITARYPLNAPLAPTEILFLQGLIAKLTEKLPVAA